MRKMKIAATVGGLAGLAALALPASASDVTLALNNPGGSRTVYVEDLLGQPLTTLDFGTTRTQPVRVRVVDTTMDRAGFQVSATMSNLYKATGTSSYDYTASIPSSAVTVGYPQVPLSMKDVSAVVTPVFDLAENVTGQTLCTSIQLVGGTVCDISVSGVRGLRQTVTVPVDLADLTALPLVPQQGETGAFTTPNYSGIGDHSGKPDPLPTATSRRFVSGGLGTVLTTIQSRLATLVGATAPATSVVDAGTVTDTLRTALGTGTGGVPVFDLLSLTDAQALVDGLVATLKPLVPADVVAQSGTYLSFPLLNVAVPSSAEAGDYRGTLVVTSVQL